MALDLSIRQIVNFGLTQTQLNTIFAYLTGGALTVAPVTNGAEPPAFITDGAGQIIYQAFAP